MKKIFNELTQIKAKDLLPFLIEKAQKSPAFGIIIISISALFIFTAGKSFGKFLYLLTN